MFKAVTGLTPKRYGSAHRSRKVREGLKDQHSVTDALYDAGFNSNLAVANFAGICNAASISSGVCPVGSEGKYAYHFTARIGG